MSGWTDETIIFASQLGFDDDEEDGEYLALVSQMQMTPEPAGQVVTAQPRTVVAVAQPRRVTAVAISKF